MCVLIDKRVFFIILHILNINSNHTFTLNKHNSLYMRQSQRSRLHQYFTIQQMYQASNDIEDK